MPVDEHKDNMITVLQFTHTFQRVFHFAIDKWYIIRTGATFYQVLDFGNDDNLFCAACSRCMYAFRLQCIT